MAEPQCEAVRAELDDLLDGRVQGERASRLSAHLEACSACAAEWQERQALAGALRAALGAPLPAGFEQRLHRRLVAAALSLPDRPRRGWGQVLVPVSTGLLGFLAAAALAAPLLSQPTPPVAGSAGGARSAVVQSTLRPPTAAPDLSVSPGPAASSGGGSVMNAFAAAVSPASGSASTTAALSLTVVAASPAQAVERLTTAAAQAGGRVSAMPAGPAASGAPPAAQVATLDATVPAAATRSFLTAVGTYGTILARTGSVPETGGGSVRVLVTVLAPAPVASAASSTTAGAPAAPALRLPNLDRALLRVGRSAPLAGGLLLAALALGLLWSGLRRRSLP